MRRMLFSEYPFTRNNRVLLRRYYKGLLREGFKPKRARKEVRNTAVIWLNSIAWRGVENDPHSEYYITPEQREAYREQLYGQEYEAMS